jgi:hypothetical protein
VRENSWTKRDEHLAAKYRRMGMRFDEIGELLGRTAVAIRSRLKVLGCVDRSRFFTDQQKSLVREHYGRMPTKELAASIGRSVQKIYALAHRMGLDQGVHWPPGQRQALRNYIAARHAEERSDGEIARGWNAEHPELSTDRRWVSEVRKDQCRLPAHGMRSKRFRARVAEKTKEQLVKAGLPSIGYLRLEAYKSFCVRQGWPQVSRPRLAQILNLLYEQGPKTLPEIAAAIGVRWRTDKRHPNGIGLPGNGPGGSYTAELTRLGLVVRLGRKAKYGPGRGQRRFLYAMAPGVVRGPVSVRSEAS